MLKLSQPVSLIVAATATIAAVPAERDLPASISRLRLATPYAAQAFAGDEGGYAATLDEVMLVRLQTPAGAGLSGADLANRLAEIEEEQEAFLARNPEARVVARARLVLNAVFVVASPIDALWMAADPAVQRLVPVAHYQMSLSETVPYIGATSVQAAGFDGSGVRVAVLDSGVDYTHAAFGGSGDPADYATNDPTIIEPGTFPTAKVVGGYDFVGGEWPSGPRQADPDPLDDGVQAGHGTHVAHIIGGNGGVAPGADLYAVKVCSSVSNSCNGVALILGMEFAVDPNGDLDPSDHVDVVNMSLGAIYGQPFDDDLSAAVESATGYGVLTVAAAGNGSNKPYIVDTPASAPTAIAVAQTQVPSASLQRIDVDGTNYAAVYQRWSVPLTSTLAGPVQYGDGAGGNLNGCAPFASGSLAGLVVLVDRGACNFTLKISNISQGGGLAGIIGLVAPGAPFAGGDGGDRPIGIPGYMISQEDADGIKAQIGAPGTATLDPDNVLELVGQMVGSSSRGPQHESTHLIKPDIGAPGASISAIAGTGTGESPFSGTSGATPMVAGSAALLLQAEPNLSPLEIKARLTNTADTNIDTGPFTGLAPITRIGGGEVRVDRALATPVAAWQVGVPAGSVSFGFVDADSREVLKARVRVRNYSPHSLRYRVTSEFRYLDDQMTGAVSVKTVPPRIWVSAGGSTDFWVLVFVHGSKLPGNHMSSGPEGPDPSALTINEFDGYLRLRDRHGRYPIHLPWHVLPRQAAALKARHKLKVKDGVATVLLRNRGVGTAQNDAYSLLAVSPDIPEGGIGAQSPMPDLRAVGINTFWVPPGFCSAQDSFVWVFALNTWERQQHLLPVVHNVVLDTNRDGVADYVVFNRDLSFASISDGRQVTWAQELATGNASAYFYAEHATNSANTVLTVCAEQIGMSIADVLTTQVDMLVYAQDWYYGGPGDLIDGLTVTPFGEQYVASVEDIPGKERGIMEVTDYGAFPGNAPELGTLLFTNGDRGAGARGGATANTEALLFAAPGVNLHLGKRTPLSVAAVEHADQD
jgi:subtilisin family serine protease